MVQLLCRTVKLSWFDHETHRGIIEDAKAFLEKGTSAHYHLALKILNTLVQVLMGAVGSSDVGWQDRGTTQAVLLESAAILTCTVLCLAQEMNLATPGRTLTQQRKTAINFRDTCLFKVFQLSLYTLQVRES